jgi:hypothetical protein
VLITTINIRGESTKDNLLLELKETFKELSLANSSVDLVLIGLVNAIILLFFIFSFASHINILSLLVLLSQDYLALLINSTWFFFRALLPFLPVIIV